MPTPFHEPIDYGFSKAVSSVLNNTTTPLTFAVTTGTGARFPVDGKKFMLTVHSDSFPADNPFADADFEVMMAVARPGNADNMTVTRTDPKAHPGTPHVQLLIMAQHVKELQNALHEVEKGPVTVPLILVNDSTGRNWDFPNTPMADSDPEIMVNGLPQAITLDYVRASARVTFTAESTPVTTDDVRGRYYEEVI